MFKNKQKERRYLKKYYKEHKKKCKSCNKLIGGKVKSGLCKSCCRRGKRHHNYKHGKRCRYIKRYCINCNKTLDNRAKRCKSCAKKSKNNPMYKTDKFNVIKHHIYLRQNGGKTLKLTRSKHTQLHNKAYEYIYKVYGEKGIDKYIKWFDNFYKLKGVK